ncbi:hypothetical protein A3742_23710 [Oleiphilus sp. HI0071]|nr:hypothetical protein A3742_23710 [Oleiphilus sp. HI0071]KZZ78063.1 hypothetical protein A3767_18880 [Oleiphilus sp. HI0133]
MTSQAIREPDNLFRKSAQNLFAKSMSPFIFQLPATILRRIVLPQFKRAQILTELRPNYKTYKTQNS